MRKIGTNLRKSADEIKNPRAVIVSALLISMSLVIDRFFTIIITPTLHFNISFITKAVTGLLYGPVVALYAGALNDIVAYIAYPKGAYFIGFTISAALTGMIYGLFFYKVRLIWWRVLAAQSVVTVFINLGLNTLWLSIMYKEAAMALLMARFFKNIILLPIEIIVILAVTSAAYKAHSLVLKRQ